jgi:hypothetical protein
LRTLAGDTHEARRKIGALLGDQVKVVPDDTAGELIAHVGPTNTPWPQVVSGPGRISARVAGAGCYLYHAFGFH